jgi:hypothetical protein
MEELQFSQFSPTSRSYASTLMPFIRVAAQFSAAATLMFLASCGNPPGAPQKSADGKPVNPFPAGTYDHFRAEPSYPKTHSVWKNHELLEVTHPENSSIVINLAKQRGFLLNGNRVVIDYPICSGIKSRPTPKGTFYILEKIVDKSSNKYGRIYDAEGKLVHGDADITLDAVPEGGRFVGAPMRYWMRLTYDGVGHHIGPVKRYPASHACIRGPSQVMPIVYSKIKEGTRVIVE